MSEALAGGEAEEARWIGYIDGINQTVVNGWAYDAADPSRSVPIELLTSSGRRMATLAAQFRQDVKDAGYGSGNYGFAFDVGSLNLKDDTVVIRFAESKVAITRTPLSFAPQQSLLVGPLPKAYTAAMQILALDAREAFAALEGGAAGAETAA